MGNKKTPLSECHSWVLLVRTEFRMTCRTRGDYASVQSAGARSTGLPRQYRSQRTYAGNCARLHMTLLATSLAVECYTRLRSTSEHKLARVCARVAAGIRHGAKASGCKLVFASLTPNPIFRAYRHYDPSSPSPLQAPQHA